MMTIGKLAREFGLSRGTLLYYDSIGLLSPSLRTDSDYRVYSERDVERLRQICQYRAAGLPLKDIARLLNTGSKAGYAVVLKKRLAELSDEISAIRAQQHLIVEILKRSKRKRTIDVMDKNQWVALLRAAGLDEDGMRAWHRAFERLSGACHHDFLRSLGISEQEIRKIRAWSK